ncbi:MAG: PP2C family serine/threonine-protein phosphatase [Chlamydiae bacterium]|nr:PP2C family serine/threonine-protein phosphatase [Chlamydiota bacterium]
MSAKEDVILRNGSQPIAESHRIGDWEVGICHFIGRRDSMEDEHLATSFELLAGGRPYPVSLFGVFDGHAGR